MPETPQGCLDYANSDCTTHRHTQPQAVSKLGYFEDVLQQLLDLVTQQDEAMERLEAKAERANAMAKAGGGGAFSVLGIVADHPALKAGGGGGAAAAGAGAPAGVGAGSAALARSSVGANGSISGGGSAGAVNGSSNGRGGMGAAAGSGSARGAASRRGSATALGGGGADGADGEASAPPSGLPLSGRQRLQGTVRAIGTASRLRNMLARSSGGASGTASGTASGNNSAVFRGSFALPPGTAEITEDGGAVEPGGNSSSGGGVGGGRTRSGAPGDGGGSGSIRVQSSTGMGGGGGGGDSSSPGGSMRHSLAAGLQRPRRSSILAAASGPTPGLKSALKGSSSVNNGGGPSGTYMGGEPGSPMGTARLGSLEPSSRQGTSLTSTPRGPDWK